MRTLRKTPLVLLLVAAGAAAAAAAPAPETAAKPDPAAPGLSLGERFQALVDRVQLEQREISTLAADFEQVKTSEFLAATEESRGTVTFASPDKVRWEYVAPKPISLVIRDDWMLTWYRDLGRAERVKVGRLSTQVLQYMNASGSLESLLKYFRATASFPDGDEPYKLELEPRFARVARRLASMTLWIDRELFVPIRVRYGEPNGDVTEYRLSNLKVNEPVAPGRFEIELPPGVEVREIDLDRGRAQRPSPPGR